MSDVQTRDPADEKVQAPFNFWCVVVCARRRSRENRRMAEPFKKAKEDVAVLTKELEAYDGEKALLRQAKARLLVAENRLNSLKWEDEVLRQKHLEVRSSTGLKEKHRNSSLRSNKKRRSSICCWRRNLRAARSEGCAARRCFLGQCGCFSCRKSRGGRGEGHYWPEKDAELASINDETSRIVAHRI